MTGDFDGGEVGGVAGPGEGRGAGGSDGHVGDGDWNGGGGAERYVGRRAIWVPNNQKGNGVWSGAQLGEMGVEVEIVDATFRFGRVDLTIRPVAGVGGMVVQAWQVRVDGIDTPPRPKRPDRAGRMIGDIG